MIVGGSSVSKSEESALAKAISESRALGKKRIALINPPSSFLTDDRVFFASGLLYIAGVALEAGHEVEMHDLSGYKDYQVRAQNIGQQQYDLYGLTATSPQFSYAVNILQSIKAVNPHARVVVGGPHATMFADLRKKRLLQSGGIESKVYESDVNFRSLELFDQIIEGEESGIFEALKDLGEKNPRKLVYAGVFDGSLDELPFLPRHLIDMGSYLFKDDGNPKFDIDGGPATSVISQRGCPFSCNFCSGRNVEQYRFIKNPRTGNIRAYSPERIVAELNHVNAQFPEVTGFMFYDDELNLHRDTTLALMNALARNNRERRKKDEKPYSFRGFVKSELFVRHPEVAPAMRQAGFSRLLSGFESGSDRILKDYVKKHTTTRCNLEAAERAFEHGIRMKALMMVGQPTETIEDIRMTEGFLTRFIKLAQGYQVEPEFDLTILTPYPGSQVYDDAKKNTGRHSDEFQRVLGDGELYLREIDFAKESAPYKTAPGESEVHIRTETLSSGDLLALRQEIDDNLRAGHNLGRNDRRDPTKSIEHSMGQTG